MDMLELNHLVMRMCMAGSVLETEMWKREMILESAEAMGMIIANTWFKKNGTEKKVTFESRQLQDCY